MRILCFGESLVRLATDAHERLEDAHMMEISYSGAEATVAASLSMQGDEVFYASKTSTNRIGENALMSLSAYGINTSNVLRGPGRVGLYYVERGKSIRPTIVTYDRTGTALALANHDEFDWDHILNGIEMVFLSGIIPAISNEMRIACKECLVACKGRGIKVAFDINYRASMWSPSDAKVMLRELLPLVDVLTASEDDILLLEEKPQVNRDSVFNVCQNTMSSLQRKFDIANVAFIVRDTDRYDIASFRGAIITEEMTYFSKEESVSVSDLSCCGSMFSAGIVHAIASKWDAQHAIDYATIASAYKATIRGDYSLATESDLQSLLDSSTFKPRTIQ
ncbi:hypothetical protein HMPREF1008_00089 [Olsenella sp. oral taxon 809 str. F0356]|uniref:sugar kinase n=1 Tax=Olsenella sp. oral taxon 809 TaxID=661086 RepID=UPI000231EF6A|nr:sugar kinase [Olsenella sp. oral taxon 809]EHF03048.1 hypothetical protein HMPREF1008_00089 [Olsenella sp. oral taxon 809 str. F0356]